ncbi:hypothetical protein PVAND_011100 [Polypedilum vanderplanki]|uniref:C2H2-type domain-containing protein n=1 Tax=Polypedilum vanderplanki TaxID=319348 RepID=A0A9J6CHL2_POLVA|nr:hypothetical protein PVAND_011100 [Polypedilum vanderplanki]
MIENIESSKIALVISEESEKFQPPSFIKAPDIYNVSQLITEESMPKLIPAPAYVEKRSFLEVYREFAGENPITLDDMIVPIKKRKTMTENSEFSNKQKLEIAKINESNRKVINMPRTKITTENFSQISNMGFSVNYSQIVFKCFSKWCNFKTKSKDRFQQHLQAHHQHEKSLQPFNHCNTCKDLMEAKNLHEEFQHMITFHLEKYSSVKRMEENKIEAATSDDLTNKSMNVEKVESNEKCETEKKKSDFKEECEAEIKKSDESIKVIKNENESNASEILKNYLKEGPIFKTEKPDQYFEDGEIIELDYSDDEEEPNLIIESEEANFDDIKSDLEKIESPSIKDEYKKMNKEDFSSITKITLNNEALKILNSVLDENCSYNSPNSYVDDLKSKMEKDDPKKSNSSADANEKSKINSSSNEDTKNSNLITDKTDKSVKETEIRVKRKYIRKKFARKTFPKRQCIRKIHSYEEEADAKKFFQNDEIAVPTGNHKESEKQKPKIFENSIVLQKSIEAAACEQQPKKSKVGRPRKNKINGEKAKFFKNLITKEKSVLKNSSTSPPSNASPVVSNTSSVQSVSYLPIPPSPRFVFIVKPIEKEITGPKAKKSFPNNPEPNEKTNLKILKSKHLMQWQKVSRSNQKYEIAFNNMKKKNSLISLFKCMGRECSYTTNLSIQMLNHLNHHESERIEKENQLRNKYEPKRIMFQFVKNQLEEINNEMKQEMAKIKDFYLYCAYCLRKEKDTKALVHHINDIHRKDIYQCGYCFYRSCSKQTCFEHCKDFHRCYPNLIYECPEVEAYKAAIKRADDRLIRKRIQFVTKLRCKLCEIGYYALAPYLKHMEEFHSSDDQQPKCYSQMSILEELFKHNAYGMYQCLYCVYGVRNEEKMRQHLTEHPSEFAFTCKREPPKYVEQDEEKSLTFYYTLASTSIINLEKNVKVEKFTEDVNVLNNFNVDRTIDEVLRSKM